VEEYGSLAEKPSTVQRKSPGVIAQFLLEDGSTIPDTCNKSVTLIIDINGNHLSKDITVYAIIDVPGSNREHKAELTWHLGMEGHVSQFNYQRVASLDGGKRWTTMFSWYSIPVEALDVA
jgi:hypothetical protein